ncbi:hypothetical protein Btru_009447 [Bulinus truncatus]|nr:hypothetical protein Btru_009447 [Bulinus truncatus]
MHILFVNVSETHPCVNRTALYELLKKAVVDSEIVYYVVENKTHLDRWDFSGAFGFVVSVVTTIGYSYLNVLDRTTQHCPPHRTRGTGGWGGDGSKTITK